MNRLSRVVLALPLALSLPAFAETDGPVRVTVEVGKAEKGSPVSKSVYELTGFSGEGKLALTRYVRVPYPAVGTEGGYTFQNVGFSVTMEVASAAPDAYRVHGQLEASVVHGAPPQASSAPPTIGTLNSEFDVVAKRGKPVRAVSADEPSIGKVSVDVTVEPLD